MQASEACKKGDVGQLINLIDRGYKVHEPSFTRIIFVTFAAQANACDVLIESQAGINVGAIHQHAQIRVSSCLWILLAMLFIRMSPNSCSGA